MRAISPSPRIAFVISITARAPNGSDGGPKTNSFQTWRVANGKARTSWSVGTSGSSSGGAAFPCFTRFLLLLLPMMSLFTYYSFFPICCHNTIGSRTPRQLRCTRSYSSSCCCVESNESASSPVELAKNQRTRNKTSPDVKMRTPLDWWHHHRSFDHQILYSSTCNYVQPSSWMILS